MYTGSSKYSKDIGERIVTPFPSAESLNLEDITEVNYRDLKEEEKNLIREKGLKFIFISIPPGELITCHEEVADKIHIVIRGNVNVIKRDHGVVKKELHGPGFIFEDGSEIVSDTWCLVGESAEPI